MRKLFMPHTVILPNGHCEVREAGRLRIFGRYKNHDCATRRVSQILWSRRPKKPKKKEGT